MLCIRNIFVMVCKTIEAGTLLYIIIDFLSNIFCIFLILYFFYCIFFNIIEVESFHGGFRFMYKNRQTFELLVTTVVHYLTHYSS